VRVLPLPLQVIKEARNRLAAQYGPKAVAFEFAQVGQAATAAASTACCGDPPDCSAALRATERAQHVPEVMLSSA
jgi:hypothetical protein